MNSQDLQRLDGQPVLVTTSTGTPISIGRMKVSENVQGSAIARVDVIFSTETMSCVIGVPASRWAEILESWHSETFRYRLPPGDSVWVSKDQQAAPEAPSEPQVMGYPLPPVKVTPSVPTRPTTST